MSRRGWTKRSEPTAEAIAAANAAAADEARPPAPPPVPVAVREPPASPLGRQARDSHAHEEHDEANSVASNASVSSYNSSTREQHRRAIATAFFGPMSTTTAVVSEADDSEDDDESFVNSQRSVGSIGTGSSSRRRRRRAGSNARRRQGSSEGLLERIMRQRTASDSALAPSGVAPPSTAQAAGLDDAADKKGERRAHKRAPVDRQSSLPSKSVSRQSDETPEERARRKENVALFEELVHKANTHQPVQFDTFKQRPSRKSSKAGRSKSLHSQVRAPGSGVVHGLSTDSSSESDEEDKSHEDGDVMDERLNTELLEAYIAYAKSIGHEPNIQVDAKAMLPFGATPMPRDSHVDRTDAELSDEDDDEDYYLHAARASYIQERPCAPAPEHFWTDFLGTRYSKRRGCVQFWTWLLIGVGVVVWLGVSLSTLQLNEVLHLDAFVVQDVVVTQDFTYLHLLDEVSLHLKYTIETPDPSQAANPNASYFQVLLLYEDEFEKYVAGEPFKHVHKASANRTTYASLPTTWIENEDEDDMYFVVQPCYLTRNPLVDYCQLEQLPTSVRSSEKIYQLDQPKKMAKKDNWELFNVTYMYVNPMPVNCCSSGWRGGAYLLLFLPYVIITLFGLRLFQMVFRCESFKSNLERIYTREFAVPENEVDYWQPMPWDRKVPKTRLCGPCCWRKFRRPFEPFYTWWRHENYFTWVFCPYRNERLSRGERALIVVCSLYITFYVLFLIVMLRDSVGTELTIFTSVVLYAILVSVLPSAGKAIFKEVFKLIFRQRRKYFRAKAAGGDLKGFSFRLAFLLQVLVAVILTVAQIPIFYVWLYRSCLFLKKFMYFAVLAAVMRMSIMGLAQDLAWYLVLKTWGWKDLCPACTERIQHCDCFNDELLVLAVERVGPKWELIKVLDRLLAKQHHYDAQFELYTTEQLRERWEVLVERAEKHMDKMDKLRAYREKKRLEALRRRRQRRSFRSFLSFRGTGLPPTSGSGHSDAQRDRKSSEDSTASSKGEEDEDAAREDQDLHVCSLREKKVLALHSKIQLDAFEKHYDANIAEVFGALAHSVMRLRRHGDRDGQRGGNRRDRWEDELEKIPEEELADDETTDARGSRASTTRDSTSDSNSNGDGETMWVFDTPAQRLKRREEEKLRRARAFRVLQDYEIESVEPPLTGDAHTAAASPGLTSGVSNAPLSATGRQLSSGRERDSRWTPLLSTRNRSAPREEDLVVLGPDKRSKREADELNDVPVTCVDTDYNDDDDDSVHALRDLERGDGAPPSSSRVYAVTERQQTLFRRVSASASAFAAWALNYDPNAPY